MIKNFEQDTCTLSDYEKGKILPAVVEVLQGCIGKQKAITNKCFVVIRRVINLFN